jgi:hypothetical protein
VFLEMRGEAARRGRRRTIATGQRACGRAFCGPRQKAAAGDAFLRDLLRQGADRAAPPRRPAGFWALSGC